MKKEECLNIVKKSVANKKLSRKLLFSLPYGYCIMSNAFYNPNRKEVVPYFFENVSPLDDREFQWERIKGEKVNGKSFFIIPSQIAGTEVSL
jgi:hypothetical protein